MKVAKKARDVKPGEVYQDDEVQSVEVGEATTVLHFRIGATCLWNDELVLVKVQTTELRDAFGRMNE